MVMIWKTHPFFVILYILTVGIIELSFLSSLFYKFVDGGYLPFVIALVLGFVMFSWNYGYRKKYMYELQNKVSLEKFSDIVSDQRIQRIQAVGLFYSQLVQGITPIFTHYISNVPALHSDLVFISFKSLPVSRVLPEERFLFQQIRPHELIFRCIVRYGYNESKKEPIFFEEILINQLKAFVLENDGEGAQRKLALVDNALGFGGVVYLMGEGETVASSDSSFVKKLTIDYLYNLLNKCVRQPDEMLFVPRNRLHKVGMSYLV